MNRITYVDGSPSHETELTKVPRVRFPLQQSVDPDTFTREYGRDYRVKAKNYVSPMGRRTSWTNLITNSELFTAGAWTKTNGTATAAAGTAPDGQETLNRFLETAANGEHSLAQAATVAALPTEASAWFAAGLTRRFVKLTFTDSAAAAHSAFFDILAGTGPLSASAGVTGSMVTTGDGQFRATIRFTPAAGSGTLKINAATDALAISYAGSTSAGFYAWGAQVMTGTETPYASTTTGTRTINAPDRDPRDPMAFLVRENDAQPVNSAWQIVSRDFCRVPLQQVVPSSQFVRKPLLTGDFPQVIGDALVTQPDPSIGTYNFYSQLAVTGDSGPPSNAPTSGTFTLTFGANTTSGLAYNASASTVSTALNALASVVAFGGVAVTGTNSTGYVVAFNYSQATVDIASLVAANATVQSSVGITQNGTVQDFLLTPFWNTASGSGTSSFTPAAANPMLVGNSTGDRAGGISWSLGSGGDGSRVATGGTFTLTVFGQTTASIAWDASFATTEAALNALSNVSSRGGYTVSSLGLANGVPVYAADLPAAALTGGTFTITIAGQTTGAIAYNASVGTIQTAINALSNVTARGGVIVSGDGFSGGKQSFRVTFANIPAITGNATGLTPSGSNVNVTLATSRGLSQTLTFNSTVATQRFLTVFDHGITAGGTIIVNSVELDSTTYAVINDNVVALNAASGFLNVAPGAITTVGRLINRYVGGGAVVQTRVKLVTDFFLIGVTPGIDSIDDIPLPEFQGDDAGLLFAILDGDESINYEVGQLEQWRGTPILARTITTLNASQL